MALGSVVGWVPVYHGVVVGSGRQLAAGLPLCNEQGLAADRSATYKVHSRHPQQGVHVFATRPAAALP